MSREIKSEIVTVRLTPTEKARLDEMGGAAEVLRRVLRPAVPAQSVVPITTAGIAPGYMVWFDGTAGPSWPAVATA